MAKRELTKVFSIENVLSDLTTEQQKRIQEKIAKIFNDYIESNEFTDFVEEQIQTNLESHIEDNMPDIVESIVMELDHSKIANALNKKLLAFFNKS